MTHVRTVHVRVPVAEAERAADLLFAAGASAVEERDAGGRHAVLVADIEVDAVAALGALTGPWTFEVVDVDVSAVDGLWRDHAEPVEVGSMVIAPSWKPVPRSARTVVTIDSSAAFGSGTHPTTRQCLLALQRHLRAGWRVLDVGCGSGVLAIAAARLGATAAVAYDIDPRALDATRLNAARNGVDHVVDVRPELPDATFDLVVANIGAAALVALREELVERLAPGGVLVASGLLEPQVGDVTAAFDGFDVDQVIDEGWATLTLTRR